MTKKEKIFGLDDYKKIHNLVYAYQNNDVNAAEQIIKAFNGILSNYLALLKYNQFNIKDFSTRNFVKMFITDKEEKKKLNIFLHTTKFNSNYVYINKYINLINNIFKGEDVEDIENELITVLLTMCNKYKDTKPSFHQYVKKNFHFYVYRHFEKSIKDPLFNGYTTNYYSYQNSDTLSEFSISENLPDKNFVKEEEVLLNNLDLYYEMKNTDKIVIKTNKSITKYDDEFFDINWINGVTCSDIFKVLSSFERHILVLWYLQRKTDTNIAEKFGVCRTTINKKRRIAKDKLKKKLIENKMLNM